MVLSMAGRSRKRSGGSSRLRLEWLEDRLLLATSALPDLPRPPAPDQAVSSSLEPEPPELEDNSDVTDGNAVAATTLTDVAQAITGAPGGTGRLSNQASAASDHESAQKEAQEIRNARLHPISDETMVAVLSGRDSAHPVQQAPPVPGITAVPPPYAVDDVPVLPQSLMAVAAPRPTANAADEESAIPNQ